MHPKRRLGCALQKVRQKSSLESCAAQKSVLPVYKMSRRGLIRGGGTHSKLRLDCGSLDSLLPPASPTETHEYTNTNAVITDARTYAKLPAPETAHRQNHKVHTKIKRTNANTHALTCNYLSLSHTHLRTRTHTSTIFGRTKTGRRPQYTLYPTHYLILARSFSHTQTHAHVHTHTL